MRSQGACSDSAELYVPVTICCLRTMTNILDHPEKPLGTLLSLIAPKAFIANSVYNESSFLALRGQTDCFSVGRKGL